MTRPTKRVGAEVDRELWERFRTVVKENKGRIKGHVSSELETAIREYIRANDGRDTYDRLVQVIENQEKILAVLDSEIDGAHTYDDDVPETEKKRNKILTNLREKSDRPVIHEKELEAEIMTVAGSNAGTVRDYKDKFKKLNEAFPDPRENYAVWYLDAVTFVNSMETELNGERLSDLVYEYGVDWWDGRVNDEDSQGEVDSSAVVAAGSSNGE